MNKLAAILAILPGLLWAAPPVPKTIDFQGTVAPDLAVYQANEYTVLWTVRNNTPLNLTGYTPFCYWAVTNTSASIVTAACAIATATAGTFTATFSPAALNTNGAMIYGVGVSSGNVTVARQGRMTITADPFASGAGAVVFTTNVNLSLITFTGVGNGSWSGTFAGNGAGLTGITATAVLDAGEVNTIVASNYMTGAQVTNALAGAGSIKAVTNDGAGIVTVSNAGGPTVTVGVAASAILAVGASNYYPLADGRAASNTAANASNVAAAVRSVVASGSNNWNTAYGWGNHASAGYAYDGMNVPFMTLSTKGESGYKVGFLETYVTNSGAPSYGTVTWINSDLSEAASIYPIGGHLYITDTNATFARKIFDADNDGTGSGLDADLLDGQEGAYYLNGTNLLAASVSSNAMDAATDAAYRSAGAGGGGSLTNVYAYNTNTAAGVVTVISSNVLAIGTNDADAITHAGTALSNINGAGYWLTNWGNVSATNYTTTGTQVIFTVGGVTYGFP